VEGEQLSVTYGNARGGEEIHTFLRNSNRITYRHKMFVAYCGGRSHRKKTVGKAVFVHIVNM